MSTADTVTLLNQVLTIEYRSMPMYLHDADPWARSSDESARETLANIIADQLQMSQKVAAFLQDMGEAATPGEFPMEFTDLHFLSLDFLLHELLGYQKAAIAGLETCVAGLAHDREAQDLAAEALGMERAHLEAIEQIAAQPAAG